MKLPDTLPLITKVGHEDRGDGTGSSRKHVPERKMRCCVAVFRKAQRSGSEVTTSFILKGSMNGFSAVKGDLVGCCVEWGRGRPDPATTSLNNI